jgi:hypothetical protein
LVRYLYHTKHRDLLIHICIVAADHLAMTELGLEVDYPYLFDVGMVSFDAPSIQSANQM